jgi:hypothetical protein
MGLASKIILFKKTGFDKSAMDFISASGITSPQAIGAINTLCIDLKKFGFWNDILMFKPYAGTNATQNSYNLINPALYQSTWFGGVTHSANGVTYNGTNGYQNHNFNPSSNGFPLNNGYISLYVTARTTSDVDDFYFGCRATSRIEVFATGASPHIVTNYAVNDNSSNLGSGKNITSFNLFVRLSNNSIVSYTDGIQNTTHTVSSVSVPNLSVFEGCHNVSGTPSRYAGITNISTIVGTTAINDSQNIQLYNIVRKYQLTMGRAV